MGWHYKSPLNFPAAYLAAIRQVASHSDEEYMLGGFTQIEKAKQLAERIRHLKWCVRQEPAICPDLFQIFNNYDIRTKIVSDNLGHILWLYATPNKVGDFIEHNPELAKEILPQIS